MSPLVAAPGHKFSYSTHGFSVAGAMIEKRTNLPFQIYAGAKFNSWGFPGVRPEFGKNAKRAAIYRWENGKNVPSTRDNLSWKYAGGGFEASVHDLALFAHKLMAGGILPKARMEDMWTSRKDGQGKSTGYGLGWGIGSIGGKRLVDHSGSQNGANSYWRLYPDDDIAVVVLSNRADHNPAHLGDFLGKLATAADADAIDPYSPPK